MYFRSDEHVQEVEVCFFVFFFFFSHSVPISYEINSVRCLYELSWSGQLWYSLKNCGIEIFGRLWIGKGRLGLEEQQALRKATCTCVSVFLCERTSSPWLLWSVRCHLVISTSSYEVTSFEVLGVLGRDSNGFYLIISEVNSWGLNKVLNLSLGTGGRSCLWKEVVLARDVFLRACSMIFVCMGSFNDCNYLHYLFQKISLFLQNTPTHLEGELHIREGYTWEVERGG